MTRVFELGSMSLGSTFPKLRNSKRVRFDWRLSRRSCEFTMLLSLCAFERVIALYVTGKMSLVSANC